MDKKNNVVHFNIFLVKDGLNKIDKIINKTGCKDPTEIPISGLGKGKTGRYPFLFWDDGIPHSLIILVQAFAVSQPLRWAFDDYAVC